MSDLKNTLLNLTKTITKTSTDVFSTTKMSLNLANEEAALNNLYNQIGKKVHEIYAYGGSLGKFFDEKYLEITAIEARIKEKREQLDTAKGTKTCMACGKTVSKTSEFCPKCGHKLGDEPSYPEPVNPPAIALNQAAPDAASKKCLVCGTENNPVEKFCFSCGRML